jgi:hypothetical protein
MLGGAGHGSGEDAPSSAGASVVLRLRMVLSLRSATVAPVHHPGADEEGIPASSLSLAFWEPETPSLPLALLGRRRGRALSLQGAADLLKGTPRALLPPGQLGGALLLWVPEPVLIDPRRSSASERSRHLARPQLQAHLAAPAGVPIGTGSNKVP